MHKLLHRLIGHGANYIGRLRRPGKLALGVAAGALPVLALLVLAMAGQAERIGAARAGQAGLRVASGLTRVITELQLLQGQSHRLLHGDADAESDRQQAAGRLGVALAAADATLADHPAFEFAPAWQAQRQRLQPLLVALPAGPTRQARLAAFDSQIEQLGQLRQLAAERSGLSLDPENANHFLIDLTIERVPPLIETIGQLRATGASMLARGEPSTTEREALRWHGQAVVQQLATIKGRVEALVRAGLVPPGSWGGAQLAIDRLLEACRQMRESDVLVEAPARHFAVGSEAVVAVMRFDGDLVNHLHERLAQRADGAWRRLWLLLAAGVLVLGLQAYVVMAFGYRFALGLAELRRGVQGISSGDLSRRLELGGNDELADIGQAIEDTSVHLSGMVAEIRSSAVRVGQAGEVLADDGQQLARRTEAQASSLRESIDTVERLSNSAASSAEAAHQLDALTGKLRERAESGARAMTESVAAFRKLEESARRVAEVNGVIDDVAFQTNLLALNASVEAARAGEAGRGFAVVAAEVRQLANRCSEAAAEVRGLIDQTNDQVAESAARMLEASGAIGSVVGGVGEVSDRLRGIAQSSTDQSVGLVEVSIAVTCLDQITRDNSGSVMRSSAAARSLVEQSTALQRAVRVMRLRQGSADEAREMVERALQRVDEIGFEQAVAEFNDPQGGYLDRDMFLYAFDRSGRFSVAAGRPERLGRTLFDLPDANHAHAEATLQAAWAAVERGQGWFEYMLAHPQTGRPTRKTGYAALVADDMLIGCGVYRLEEQAGAAPDALPGASAASVADEPAVQGA